MVVTERSSIFTTVGERQRELFRRLRCVLFPCPPTVVAILRHADITLPPATNDDPLNSLGLVRAEELVHVLGLAGVNAIFASTFRRTQQTATPLTDHLGLTLQVRPANETAATELAAEIKRDHVGETVVVVSHSNLVPVIVSALGGTWTGSIGEADFDNLLWVTIPASGRVAVHHLRYGAPT
jgi:broad specificity phosphatase PhoE